MRKKRINLGILISGSGSTMESIIKATKNGKLKGKVYVCCVIASTLKAKGIKKAQNHGIPVFVVKRNNFSKGKKGQREFGNKIISILKKYNCDVVSQNGWLPLTPDNVITHFNGKIFNQHPGPLDPDNLNAKGIPIHFGGKGMHGLAVHASVLEFSKRIKRKFSTEATIHLVSNKFDEGAVVSRKKIDVNKNDTPHTLAKKVLPLEHMLFINFLESLYMEKIRPLKRTEKLIKKEDESDFYESIKLAQKQYPNG